MIKVKLIGILVKKQGPYLGKTGANIYLYVDCDNMRYKVTCWDEYFKSAEKLKIGDVISVEGKIVELRKGSNQELLIKAQELEVVKTAATMHVSGVVKNLNNSRYHVDSNSISFTLKAPDCKRVIYCSGPKSLILRPGSWYCFKGTFYISQGRIYFQCLTE